MKKIIIDNQQDRCKLIHAITIAPRGSVVVIHTSPVPASSPNRRARPRVKTMAALLAMLTCALTGQPHSAVAGQVEVRETANAAVAQSAEPTATQKANPAQLASVPTSAASASSDGADEDVTRKVRDGNVVPASTTPAKSRVRTSPTPAAQPVSAQSATLITSARVPMSAAGSADNTDNAFNEDIGSAKTDRVVFNQVPVRVVLRAGRERILSFPNPVTLNIPEDLQALISPLDIIGKSIYMTPIAPFARTRVTVQDLVTGQIIPLDLQAASGAVTSGILDIFYAGDTNRTSQHGKATVNGPDADDTEHEPAIDMVALTRYASHRLYAPQRLLTPVPGIRQVNVSTKPATGLYRGSAALLETTPIGAWRSQDLYVTAVKFVNRGKAPVELDLNELRGHWIAATAQHVRLAGMGSEDDTTAVYLVSARPFEESR